MTAVLDALPDDVDALRALVLALNAEAAERSQAIRTLEERNGALEERNVALEDRNVVLADRAAALEDLAARLEHIIAQLRRLSFGPRSEKIDPDQLQLGLEDLEQAAAQVEAEQDRRDAPLKERRARDRRERRASLPEHLPEVEVTIEPLSTQCSCCGEQMHRIGEDASRRLDVIPAQYRVLVTRRPKYACRACEDVVQAKAPARLIEGGLPTEAMVASVLVAKYADHLPLYRQAQMLARQGIEIDRSTLACWTGYAACELAPLHAFMRAELLASTKLFVDETRAPVLDPGRGKVKTGWFWTLARDDRPWGGKDPPAVVYTYAEGRGAEHAIGLLKDFAGVLQTDGYGAYKALAARRHNGSITLAHCWAHCRRKFFELAKGGSAPIAAEALHRIGELYAIEAEIRGHEPEARRAVRQARSAPVLGALKTWLEDKLKAVSARSPTAEAIRYALGHWTGLTQFLHDGRIELDSNPVERAMRPIALNRKNALFAGSDEGGANWAVLATLVECCKLNGVNPVDYLTDVLTKLANLWPNSRIGELTPWTWKATRARA